MSVIETAWAKILATGLIAVGVIDMIFYFSEGSVNFLNWIEPGTLYYVLILFIIGIFLVWKEPIQGQIGSKKAFNIFREKLIGMLIISLLFFEYYLATNPGTLLGDIFPFVGITNHLGHGILTILLGIVAFWDPYPRVVGLTGYTPQ